MSTQSEIKMWARAAPILERLPAGKPVLVEVGVFTGFMAEHLLQRRADLIWYGVDNWLPAEQQPEPYRKTNDMHALANGHDQKLWRGHAFRRIEPFGWRAAIIEQASLDAARMFPDAAADVVFIDADHSYAGCAADLHAWWPKVRPGGYLGGHDYENHNPRYDLSGVDAAVFEFSKVTGLPFEAPGGTTYFFRKPLL